MNQVNPLHLAGLLLIVLMFLFFKLDGVKEEIAAAKSEFLVSQSLAVDLNALKSVYADKKKTKKSLERILGQRSIVAAKLHIKRDKKFVKISSQSIDAVVLNSLMGKILNGSFNIATLKIKRLSDTKASLEMEIKW